MGKKGMGDGNRSDRQALLVIDVQNYFFEETSSAYLKASPQVLPKINELVGHALQEAWPVIATSHHAPSGPGNLMEDRWRYLPRGRECSLFQGLMADERVRRLPKEYYSAFFKTDLEETLRGEKIGRIVICGVMTHLCVDTTARHAFMLGFKPIVAADACCSKTASYHMAALTALGHGFAEITTTDQIRNAQQ